MLALAAALIVLVPVLVLVLLWSGVLWQWGLQPRRALRSVERGSDLRDCSVAGLDLRGRADIIFTFGFNQRTLWPAADKLPAGFVPGEVLTNAMNPGLGVRELHRQGISGKGVSVAIIDYPILGRHPEYADKILEIHPVTGAQGVSMHGPAVVSLLVGRHCGTAPDARLYFLATPDPGRDARTHAEALDWVLDKNQTLPPMEKIRVVSVSAIPSGPGSPFRNGKAWEEAVARAEKAGVLVVDGTLQHGFLGPCNLDLQAPEEVSRCVPIPTQRGPKLFVGRLLVPVAPRTVADEYSARLTGYHYCGWMDHTLGMFGTSWSMPYCAGVLALGWQVNPHVPAERMKQLLFASAFVRPDGEKVINPPAFIAAVKREPGS
jgi:subtilisin family serine protease